LSPAEEAAHLKRRKEIWAELQSGQVAPVESKRDDGRGHRQKEFAAETSTRTGVNKRTINRAISRAEALGDDITRIKGTSLDKGVELKSRFMCFQSRLKAFQSCLSAFLGLLQSCFGCHLWDMNNEGM